MVDFNIDNYLRISPTDVILVLISTALIILFAKHFFWDKLTAFIKKRQALIQENIDSSERLKQQALEEKAVYDRKMQDAGKEAHAMIEEAKAQASEEKAEILAAARTQADRIRQAAAEDIVREQRRAEKDMATAISSVALSAAEALVKKEADDSMRADFVADFIQQAQEDDRWQKS